MLSDSMRVGVTSIVRGAGLNESSGFLRVVDLEERRVLATYTLPESAHRRRDPNPRGGNRGAKGIDSLGGRLVVANVERLFVLDSRWQVTRDFSHPWLGSVHDLLCEPDGIWVTCTDADLLTKVTWEGEIAEAWTWRGDAALAAALGLHRVPGFDSSLDYRDPMTIHTRVANCVHLNAVTRADGALLLSFGRILPPRRLLVQRTKGAVAAALLRTALGERAVWSVVARHERRIDDHVEWPVDRIARCSSALVRLDGSNRRRRGEVLVRTPTPGGVPNHNVLQIGRRLIYNDSNEGAVAAYDPESRRRTSVPLPGTQPFPRGLVPLEGGEVVLVGSRRPAALHAVDLRDRSVRWTLPLSDEPREAVYAIAPIPDRFDDPPAATPFVQ